MNNAQFKGHLVLLAEITNKDLSSPLLQYWWQTFGELPDDTLLPAFEMAKQSCKFFPSPSEFRDLLQQIAVSRGAIVSGAGAWDECERTIFRQWSEARDRVMVQENRGYPWPSDRCKHIVREELNLTVRRIAEMQPYEYGKVRERFIAAYDSGQAVAQAEIAAGPVRLLSSEVGD